MDGELLYFAVEIRFFTRPSLLTWINCSNFRFSYTLPARVLFSLFF